MREIKQNDENKTFNHNNRRVKQYFSWITLGTFSLHIESEALRTAAECREVSQRFRNHSVVFQRRNSWFDACGRGRRDFVVVSKCRLTLQCTTVDQGSLAKTSRFRRKYSGSRIIPSHATIACRTRFETAKGRERGRQSQTNPWRRSREGGLRESLQL